MKKWILAILVAVGVLTASLYLFIPGEVTIRQSATIHISQQAITRLLINDSNWAKWWPADDTVTIKKDPLQSFLLHGVQYTITDKKFSSVLIAIHRLKDTLTTSSLNIVAVAKDTVTLNWEAVIPMAYDPGKRLQQYLAAQKIKKDMGLLLNKISTFFLSQPNVYGIEVREEAVTDITLISTYDSVKGKPRAAKKRL